MLFDSIIYGPIRSRRLGLSLGINLMPTDCKVCSFDCVYCECGFLVYPPRKHRLPTREDVSAALQSALEHMQEEGEQPDVITFSGNGEPTLHPEFKGIIMDTVALRNRFFPSAKVSVLSNSTQLERKEVVEALKLCDNRILKLDSAVDDTMRLIDQPVNPYLNVNRIIQMLQVFQGDFTLQTCFLRGTHHGQAIDNTTETELTAWYKAVHQLHPKQLMIYAIDRATPIPTLEKIDRTQMESIAAPLRQEGYDVIISA